MAGRSTYMSLVDELNKIDNEASNGVLGTSDSLGFSAEVSAKYLTETPTKAYGVSAGSNLFDEDELGAITLIAGDSEAYGLEVQFSDGSNIESGSGSIWFKPESLFVKGSDALSGSIYRVQIWAHSLDDFALATLIASVDWMDGGANEVPFKTSKRVLASYYMWARCKCEANGASIEILLNGSSESIS